MARGIKKWNWFKTPWIATFYMVGAAATMGLTQVFLRWAGSGEDAVAFQLALYKYGFTLVSVIVVYREAYRSVGPQIRKTWLALLLFGFSDALATVLLFMGSLRLPLTVNSVVSDLHILVTPLILAVARIERITSRQYVAIVLGMVGAALVTGVTESGASGARLSLTWLLPLGAASLWCVASLAARKLSTVSKGLPQAAVAVCGFVLAALVLGFQGLPLFPKEGSTAMLGLAVLVAMASQVFFVLSMTSGEVVAALAGIPAYAFFGAVFGYAFFGEMLFPAQAWGMAAILGGLMLFSVGTTSRR